MKLYLTVQSALIIFNLDVFAFVNYFQQKQRKKKRDRERGKLFSFKVDTIVAILRHIIIKYMYFCFVFMFIYVRF